MSISECCVRALAVLLSAAACSQGKQNHGDTLPEILGELHAADARSIERAAREMGLDVTLVIGASGSGDSEGRARAYTPREDLGSGFVRRDVVHFRQAREGDGDIWEPVCAEPSTEVTLSATLSDGAKVGIQLIGSSPVSADQARQVLSWWQEEMFLGKAAWTEGGQMWILHPPQSTLQLTQDTFEAQKGEWIHEGDSHMLCELITEADLMGGRTAHVLCIEGDQIEEVGRYSYHSPQ